MKTPFVTGLPEHISQYRQDAFGQMQCDRCGKAVFYNAAMDLNREIAEFAERHLKCNPRKRAMNYGYVRVSPLENDIEKQTKAVKAAGAEKVFKDTEPNSRHAFESMLLQLKVNDRVIVPEMLTLARSISELIEIVRKFADTGIEVRFLFEGIDTGDDDAMFDRTIDALADLERRALLERTHAGRSAAIARGRSGGRKPALDADKLQTVNTIFDAVRQSGDKPKFGQISRSVNVSQRTLRRVWKGEYAGA